MQIAQFGANGLGEAVGLGRGREEWLTGLRFPQDGQPNLISVPAVAACCSASFFFTERRFEINAPRSASAVTS